MESTHQAQGASVGESESHKLFQKFPFVEQIYNTKLQFGDSLWLRNHQQGENADLLCEINSAVIQPDNCGSVVRQQYLKFSNKNHRISYTDRKFLHEDSYGNIFTYHRENN